MMKKLVLVTGRMENGSFHDEESTFAWRGAPGALPLSVVEHHLDTIEGDYAVVHDIHGVWQQLRAGNNAEAARGPIDTADDFEVAQFEWRREE